MTLCRGIYPLQFNAKACGRDEVNPQSIAKMLQHFPLPAGSRVILTKGDYLGEGGSNALKIVKVGEVI